MKALWKIVTHVGRVNELRQIINWSAGHKNINRELNSAQETSSALLPWIVAHLLLFCFLNDPQHGPSFINDIEVSRLVFVFVPEQLRSISSLIEVLTGTRMLRKLRMSQQNITCANALCYHYHRSHVLFWACKGNISCSCFIHGRLFHIAWLNQLTSKTECLAKILFH